MGESEDERQDITRAGEDESHLIMVQSIQGGVQKRGQD
jgi:hypothetical protein